MHDDQHGTAIVVLAALMGAAKVLDRDMTALRVVISGAGAASVACANLLLASGISDISVLDSQGILNAGRSDMNKVKAELAQRTNPTGLSGGMVEALEKADVFIGVSAGVVPEELIATMAPEGIVFALSNPDPEIHPDVAAKHAAVVANRPQRLPEPDQQRARVPRGVPRRAGRRGPQDHPADDGGRGRGHFLGGGRRSGARQDRAQSAGSAGLPCRGGSGRRGLGRLGHRWSSAARAAQLA